MSETTETVLLVAGVGLIVYFLYANAQSTVANSPSAASVAGHGPARIGGLYQSQANTTNIANLSHPGIRQVPIAQTPTTPTKLTALRRV
jgi:hypothetical protein